MIPACTLKSLKESIFQNQETETVNDTNASHAPLVLYQMAPGASAPTTHRSVNSNEKVIGILFVRPAHQSASPAIFQDLPDFHLRSGSHINFYFPGYGAYWDKNYATDKSEIAKIDGVSWYYSPSYYAKFQEDLERIINWVPSGECELLLLSVDKSSFKENSPIQFEHGIIINITELIENKLITSIAKLFYNIFNAFRKNPQTTLNKLSNHLAKKNGEKAVLDFLGVIPNTSGPIKAYERLKPYAVKSVVARRSAR
jgi:hypothetical protein